MQMPKVHLIEGPVGAGKSTYSSALALRTKGIHVAHILIDGAVDAPDTLGKMLGPEQFQALRESRGLEHDGFLLYETQAILRYLDRVLPKPALTPADPRRASRMDQVMNVNDWYLYQGVGTVIVFHRVIGPRLMGLTPDEAAIAAAMPKALAVFNELAHLLGEQCYFAGDAISLADLMVAPAVELFTATPEWSVLGAPHANLESWLARMQALPSMQATTSERVSELARAA